MPVIEQLYKMTTINSYEKKNSASSSLLNSKEDIKNNTIKIPVDNMEELIQIVNRLQEVFAVVSEHSSADKGSVELPQIVVVGAQSSGKSSVLESLVGRTFLPRGPGVVTRRPLVLQLIYTSKKDLARLSTELSHPGLEAWGVFLHKPDKRFLKFDDIRQEILDETNRVAGEQFGISPEPILLKIYSSSVNLTLVDLPGLIKVPVGDQPQDIEQRVRELVLQYIAAPHSIILAIVTANTDIATSESLQLARQVDPDGLRTLAVVTKLDLMDAGTDASDILCGCVIPVRLGIIGVLNRSQRDIQQGKSIAQALNDEAAFFKLNYPKLASKHGTPYLAKTLQNLLLDHIRSCLPDIRHRVASLMNHYQSVLKICGQPVQDKGQTLLHIITEFCSGYCSSIKGNSTDIETTELCGGARISYIFQESFGQVLESIHPLAGFNKNAILTAMRNASGTRPGLFVPEVSFELLVKRQIKRLEEPSIRCADLVHQELERVVLTTLQQYVNYMSRFHNLHRRILEVCSEILRSQLPVTHSMIKQLIAIQLAYINTSHPDFIRDAREINSWVQALHHEERQRSGESCSSLTESVSVTHELLTKIVPSTKRSFSQGSVRQSPSCSTDIGDQTNTNNNNNNNNQSSTLRLNGDREHRDCLVIERLIKSYFQIVKKSIQDNVPKTIMYCLVNNVMENLQQHLVCQLYKPEQLDELLAESKHICQQRKETNDMIKALDKAANILNDIRDTHRLWLQPPNSPTNSPTF